MPDHDQIEKDRARIDALGGVSKVADLLGYSAEGGVQRVQNWKVRGIPPAVKIQHPDLFLAELQEGASAGVPPVTQEGA